MALPIVAWALLLYLVPALVSAQRSAVPSYPGETEGHIAVGNNLCLTAPLARTGPVTLSPCNPQSSAQRWVTSLGQIVSVDKGFQYGTTQCLQVQNGLTSENAPVVLTNCGMRRNSLVIIDNSRATFQFSHTYMCLGSTGNQVVQMQCSRAQRVSWANQISKGLDWGENCSRRHEWREWRDMTSQQKQAYISGVQALRQAASTQGLRSRYDDFVNLHAQAISIVHSTPMFLPWHRILLVLYITTIRMIRNDNSIVMPYWDEGYDGQDPLSNNQVFGSGPLQFGTRSMGDGCVHDGFVSGWTSVTPSVGCLTRNYNVGFTWYDSAIMNSVVATTSNSFHEWSNNLERGQHGKVHAEFGGGGTMTYTSYSSNDAAFYLHHAAVDWYWWRNQQARGPGGGQYTGSMVFVEGGDASRSVPVSINDIFPGFNIPVSAAMTINNLCYSYRQWSQSDLTSVAWNRNMPASHGGPNNGFMPSTNARIPGLVRRGLGLPVTPEVASATALIKREAMPDGLTQDMSQLTKWGRKHPRPYPDQFISNMNWDSVSVRLLEQQYNDWADAYDDEQQRLCSQVRYRYATFPPETWQILPKSEYQQLMTQQYANMRFDKRSDDTWFSEPVFAALPESDQLNENAEQ